MTTAEQRFLQDTIERQLDRIAELEADIERLRGVFSVILEGLRSRKETDSVGRLSLGETMLIKKNAVPATERVKP